MAPPPPDTPVTSMIAVSFASSSVSCTAVSVAVPVVWPVKMVIVFDDRVKSLVRVAVLPLLFPMETMISALATALSVAVIVLLPEASATLALLTDNVTAGAVVTL